MDDNLIRIVLLIASILSGVFQAHMLGIMNGPLTETQEHGLNITFGLLGKETLQEKKKGLYKFSLLTWVLYIPYALLAFYYFYGQTVPFALLLLLTLVILIDYIYGIKNIKNASDSRELEEAGSTDRFQKSNMFLAVVITAIIIGYLI